MPVLVARIVRALHERCLVVNGDRVAVGLSGGPDSVALTLLLADALPELGAALAGIAHLHHGLRGATADADEAFCRALAARLRLQIVVEHANLRHARRGSLEAVAHDARYHFYDRALGALDATKIATGHTRNDLAETVLLRLFRGAGLRGLSGIRPVNGRVIRPLLDVERLEVLGFLRERQQDFREDESNTDVAIPRNRVRHQLLPELERHAGPRLVDRLARSAAAVAEDEGFLDEVATEYARRVVQENGDGLALNVDSLAALPLAMRRRVARGAIERLSGEQSFAAVQRVLGLLSSADGAEVHLRGVRARRAGPEVVLSGAERRLDSPPRGASGQATDPFDRFGPADGVPLLNTASKGGFSDSKLVGVLQVPGRISIPGGGWIQVEERDRSGVNVTRDTGETAVMDAAAVRLPLTVRFRLAGDRLRPFGMRGLKKLQDVFVDRKVPRDARDRVPLVVDGEGRILWVAGHVVSDEARVSSATSSVLLFGYRR